MAEVSEVSATSFSSVDSYFQRVLACTREMAESHLDELAEECIRLGIFTDAKKISPGVFTSDLRGKFGVDVNKELHEILTDFNYIDFVYGIMKMFK